MWPFSRKSRESQPAGETADRVIIEAQRGKNAVAVDLTDAVTRMSRAMEGTDAREAAQTLFNLPRIAELGGWDKDTIRQMADVLAWRVTGQITETPTIRAVKEQQEAQTAAQQKAAYGRTLKGRMGRLRDHFFGEFDIFSDKRGF